MPLLWAIHVAGWGTTYNGFLCRKFVFNMFIPALAHYQLIWVNYHSISIPQIIHTCT